MNYKPYVPASSNMAEFTLRAVVLGLIMALVLGAANAYLGLKAGMTIAATYPAAVIGMAVLRLWKGKKRGTLLEENMARTIGSIGESVAAGAIFTLPAFLIVPGLWDSLLTFENYMISSAILMVGGFIGILFVTILRRVMVEDHDLPYPESVAASEIHKAGQGGAGNALALLVAMGVGALVQICKEVKLFAASWEKFLYFKPSSVQLELGADRLPVQGTGGVYVTTPGVSPAYMGVGFIIGPVLASLNFSGGLLAWGLFVPMFMWILGPDLTAFLAARGGDVSEASSLSILAQQVWKLIVRPIAIGGMLVSACYTLYGMRKSLATGLVRAVNDLKRAAGVKGEELRTETDINFKYVVILLAVCLIATFFIYHYFTKDFVSAAVAAIVMVIIGFFFAAVSGYLVGLIGSSNNPISGLTIATVVLAALLMVALNQKGLEGVAAVLGVAAVVCVSAAVAGEMLQDLKVGHILGGTPWRMQLGDMIGIVPSAFVMVAVLGAMHASDLNVGGGLGGSTYTAPQAGLMAMLAQGIVGGNMTWPLIIMGMIMAVGFILLRVKSPMLVSVGMYLPFETTAAIFIGGMVKWAVDFVADKKNFSNFRKTALENSGVLVASGLIAGEALTGLLFAFMGLLNWNVPVVFTNPSFGFSIVVIAVICYFLAKYPLGLAEKERESAPAKASASELSASEPEAAEKDEKVSLKEESEKPEKSKTPSAAPKKTAKKKNRKKTDENS